MNRNDLPAPNKECEVCGRSYRRCAKCAQMRSRGIEAWREHCDSYECYQTLIFTQEDLSKVTQDQYDRVIAFELPEGRKPIKSIQEKLDAIHAELQRRKREVKKIEDNKDKMKKDNKPVYYSPSYSKHNVK